MLFTGFYMMRTWVLNGLKYPAEEHVYMRREEISLQGKISFRCKATSLLVFT